MRKNLLITLILGLYSPFVFPQFEQSKNISMIWELKKIEHYLESNNQTVEKSKEVFNKVLSYAIEGNSKAACIMGILYKDGIGCPIDYNKARVWFSFAYTAGSDKAAYSLGYLYLKGLGDVEQDYSKAIEWFEKSNYGMAIHWLSKCYYFGLGVEKNKEKAITILRDNPIYNSQTLLKQWEEYEREGNKSLQNQIVETKESVRDQTLIINDVSNIKINLDSLYGEWKGSLYEMDFSGNEIMEVQPTTINFIKKDGEETLSLVNISIDNQQIKCPVLWDDNSFSLTNATIPMKKKFYDHPNEEVLEYEINYIALKPYNLNGNIFLIARLESWIKNWSEPGPPLIMVVHKDINIESATDEPLRETPSITVSPNPFVEDILVTYQVQNSSEVSISLYDFYGRLKYSSSVIDEKQKGNYTLIIPGQNLIPGIYIIQIQIAGEKYSKQIIKK